ncbi:hypothetical protein TYRP_014369 [Tyrophagus putrescentiae]|nr:hypothetical protein TYRP_014369 [Tyrophagus putrescentiae]
MASTSSATPTTSSSTTSLGTNSLIDPLFTDPPDEDTVKAERKALRTKITRYAKMAATGQLIPTTEQDCNEWAEKLVEYDDFLGEAEEESPHYEKIRLIREHIRQSQADAVAAYNAHLAAQAALLGAPTGSFGGLSQHQPVHSQPAFSAAGGAFSAAATSVTSSGLGTTSSIPSLIGLSMSGAGRVSQPASSYMASSVSQPQWPPITTSAPSFQLRQSLNPLHSTLFPPSSTSSTFNQSSFRKFPTTVKKEDVPMFDGRAASWARFRELFESIVGENPNMKEIEKVEHLARAVPKRANLIRTANSWIAAMQDLEQLYADPDAVVNDVHRIVCEVRPVPKYAKLEHWMDFHEEVLKVIRLSAHSGNTLRDRLHTELMSKMGEHRFDYAEGTFRRDLAGLNDFVSTKVRNHLYVEGKDATARAHRGVPPKPKHSVHAVSQQSTPDLPCFFCDGQHLRVKCPLNMRQRTEGLRERRRCFRCLAQRSDPVIRETARPPARSAKLRISSPDLPMWSTETTAAARPKGKRSGAPIVISPTDQTYLPTFRASAEATDRRRSTNVRVFADGGSSASFVSEQTAAALGLQRRKVRPFKASVFGGGSTCPISERVTLRLRSQLDDNITNLLEALVMPGKLVMPLPLPSPELQRVARRQGIQLSESTAKEKFTEIDVLLGADQLEEILYDEGMGRIKPRASLSFEETRYGWILKGHTGKPTETYANCVYLQPEDDALSDDELPRLFGVYHSLTHEFYAPLLPELPVRPSEEPSCRGLCNDLSTVLKDPLSDDGGGHDQVEESGVPTLHRRVPLASDQRPDNNEKSARGFAYHLRDVLRAKGQYQAYTEALMAFVKDGYAIELPHPYHHTGYHLLHFPVHKPESTTPIRPVFNASSADLSSSPFILHAVLSDLFKRFAPELSRVIGDTYMDDVLLYADTAEELRKQMDQVSAVMAKASFTLHKWLTTPDVALALGLPCSIEQGSYLGVKWKMKDSQLVFTPPKQVPDHLSRRSLLSYFASIFDPLGLIGPFHTTVKLLMRDLLKASPTWDEPIGAQHEKEARSLLKDVQEYLPRVQHHRLVCTSRNIEMWAFGDASRNAYGVCLYLHDAETEQTELLLSRGHIPSRNKTIPELELVAATLIVDTFAKIQESLPFTPSRTRFFTDSQVTWHRIQADANRFPAFTSLLLGQPVLINAVAIASSDPFLQQLINNSYERLHFALTALLRVADRRMKVLRAYQQHYGTDVDLPLLTDILLWRLVQKAILPEEWHFAKEGRPLPASSVFFEEDATLVDHAVVRSYVKYVHEKHAHHAGAGATKELFGRSVHLPNCRTIVNQVVDSCLTCRRFRTAQPYAARMAPLPEDRKALKKLQEHPKGRGTTWITSDAPVNSQHRRSLEVQCTGSPRLGVASLQLTPFEQIETLLREAQMVINSRPLVTSTIDGTVLTPAHLVLGHALQNPVPVKYALTEKDDTLLEYTRLQNELEKFWRIWENEYLLSLRHYKWSQTEEPQIDELVIVRKDGVPRYAWEMGRIRQVYRAKDGRIRAVQLELVKGGNLRNRQIQNVYPLEHPARPGEDVAKPVDDSISPLPPSTRKPESAATQSSVQASRLPATSGLAPLSR